MKPVNDNQKPPPPPDVTYTKPGCAWCEVIFTILVAVICGLLIWMAVTYYQRLHP